MTEYMNADDRSAHRQTLLDPQSAHDLVSRRQTLSDMLHRAAKLHRGKMALTCGDTVWSYAALDDMVTRLARALSREGIVAGDRVAVLSRNSHWYMAVRFAVARVGAVFVPINFMLNADDVAYILEHSSPEMLFVDRFCRATGLAAADRAGVAVRFSIPGIDDESPMDDVRDFSDLINNTAADFDLPAVRPSSIAQIIYTSGTESRPKGAMLSHEAVLWQYQSCITVCDWSSAAVQLNALPLFHCAQLDAFLGPALNIGASNHIIAEPRPEIIIPAIERHRITSFFAPPTVWIALLRSPLFDQHDLSSLTRGFYGASIMPVEVLREIAARLPNIGLYNLYGQTEIAPVAVVLRPEDQLRKAGSAGKPVLHVETRVVDDDMNDIATGEIGEIVHCSPQLLTGYWRDEARTAEAFAGGWFHSGDLGTIDDEGYITVVDRKKDMIKTGGENVASREVEEAIYQHAAVSEVAVVGLPDPVWIERVTAFVVVRDGHALDDAQVLAHAREHLSAFKVPKQIVFVDSLPKNASGKILKRDLRELV